jgi:hypothetical protein
MAQEISISVKMTVSKGYLVQKSDPGTILVDMSGTTAIGGAQDIGTTAEALSITDVSTAGWAYFRNTDTTNYVEIGTGTAGSFVAFGKLKAGEACLIRLGTNAPTARANTSAIKLQFYILAD